MLTGFVAIPWQKHRTEAAAALWQARRGRACVRPPWRKQMDTLYELAEGRPVLTGVAVLAATWYALVILRERAGEKSIGGSSSVRDEEGMRRARERQQELLH